MNNSLRAIIFSVAALFVFGGCAQSPFATIPPQPAATTPNVGAAATVRVTATPDALGSSEVALPELTGVTAGDTPFTVASWNVNMNEADQPSIAAQIAAFEGIDLWVLQEAAGWKSGELFSASAGEGEPGTFAFVQGTTGGDIPLMTLYDATRFELLGWEELHEVNFTGTVRAPLVLHLLDTETGVEFLLVNNHLYRTQEDDRDHQATLLNQWARQQTLPIVAGGDYNFDYDVPDGPPLEDRGYDNLTADGVFVWVMPDELVPTQCTNSLPCRYDEVLDFIFTAGDARQWLAESVIVVRPGDFPDDRRKSDHRPVVATFLP